MATPPFASRPERVTVGAALRALFAGEGSWLFMNWNWKAALLGAGFRAIPFTIALLPRTAEAWRGFLLQLIVRAAISGVWGAVAEALCDAEPVWLAGLILGVLIPGSVHAGEYAMLRANHASHIGLGMILSIVFSAASLLVNWSLMRRGLLLTGDGAGSLGSDFRRLPAALADMLLAGPRTLARVVRGALA